MYVLRTFCHWQWCGRLYFGHLFTCYQFISFLCTIWRLFAIGSWYFLFKWIWNLGIWIHLLLSNVWILEYRKASRQIFIFNSYKSLKDIPISLNEIRKLNENTPRSKVLEKTYNNQEKKQRKNNTSQYAKRARGH